MQWSCPHCGVTLAVPYDTLGTGWSFSRCYKCGGFALIRRAEVNIIKVDKAPPGEKVILPEAGTDLSAGMLTEEAAQKFAKHTQKSKPEKPTIRPARTPVPPPAPKALQKYNQTEEIKFENESFESAAADNTDKKSPSKRTLPFGIGIAGLFVIASGISLYFQSQNAYQKVRETASESHITPAQRITTATRENIPPQKFSPTAAPLTASTAITVANNSGLSETNSASLSPLSEDKLLNPVKLSNRPVITDQVQESAMAPFKSNPSLSPAASPTLLVQTRLKRVSVHGGPGMQFPVTGIANPDIRYVVADWKDRWFKIALNSKGALNDVGWIRNDLVQIMPSKFLGNAVPDINPTRQ